MSKAAEAFRTISEVAEELEVPKHVLRFWEQRFPQIKPMKRGGGRRYYRPEDLDLLRGIRRLLHAEGYTIKGVQKILREQGVDRVKRAGGVVSFAGSPPETDQPRSRRKAKSKGDAAATSFSGEGGPSPSAARRVGVTRGGANRAARSGAKAGGKSPVGPEKLKIIAGAIAELEQVRELLKQCATRGEPVKRARKRSRAGGGRA